MENIKAKLVLAIILFALFYPLIAKPGLFPFYLVLGLFSAGFILIKALFAKNKK